jgi:hypothetical protein
MVPDSRERQGQHSATDWAEALTQIEDALDITDRKEWYGLLVGHFLYVGGSPTARPDGAMDSTWFVGPYQIEIHETANGTVSWHIATPDEALR